jgi:hypothetical protein
MPDVLSTPGVATAPGTDAADGDGPAGPSPIPERPTTAANDEDRGDRGETVSSAEPPLPNGMQRTYLTSGGSAVVAVAFLVFVAILLAYFSSSMSWAHW